jgi:hypothetical protein
MDATRTRQLEVQLNDFSPTKRAYALEALITSGAPAGSSQEAVNLHCHTFFSYNAYGYSPSGLAWLARQRGFRGLGIVDFDALDGVDEFLEACELLGVRGSAGIETRVFIPEFASREINSPGEPGVYYYMGIGFPSSRPPANAASILADMRRRAENRNRTMLDCINAYLSPVTVDYDRDVLTLTPGGNATERHLLAAYQQAAAGCFPDCVPFWAEKLQMAPEQIRTQIGDAVKFPNTLRAKLMKRGGVGYAQPGVATFPSLDKVNQLILACGALPCATWLDGTSAGEQAVEELLSLLIGKGAVALNIIPDRNWNVADPQMRALKVQKLYEVVTLAGKLDLPLNVGTEMNAPGQKLVDDFETPELAPVRQAFLDGANFIYGHTVLQRALGLGYQSEWATTHLPSRRQRNTFYTQVGRLTPPGQAGMGQLKSFALASDLSPAEVLDTLRVTYPA